MNRPIVYLAGPITGCDRELVTNWRQAATDYLEVGHGMQVLSPMRAKEELWQIPGDVGPVEDYSHLGSFFTSRGIMARDFSDVKRADLLLANLLVDPGEPSIGTCMELAWAYAMQKPVVVVIEEDSAYLQHPLVREAIGGLRFDNLEDAAHAAAMVLNG